LHKHPKSETYYSQSARLIAIGVNYRNDKCAIRNQSFVDEMRSSFNMIQIFHLEVTFGKIFINTFINFLHLFPDLDLSKFSCRLLHQLDCLSVEDSEILRLVTNNNKITKVSLLRMTKLEPVFFLINLFPRKEYFEMTCEDNIDLELFVRSILKNNTKCMNHLSSLCLYGEKVNDQLAHKLQKIIDLEKLLDDYTIKCMNKGKIYLQWNLH
jgi:hypothetical protein